MLDYSMNNIGILDPNGKKINPLTGNKYANIYANTIDPKTNKPTTYKHYANLWSKFPMYLRAKEIIQAIKDHNIIFIRSGTGSGKTVLTPKFVLHALEYKHKVLVTIPKKLPTHSSAEFAAQTLDVTLGEEVGFYFKGKREINRGGKESILTYTTTGSLLSRITGNDPDLSEYSALVIDEAHERSIQMDLQFLLIREVLRKRPDFKLVIMSATIDLQKFIDYFSDIGSFAEFDVGGETAKPITDYYLPKPPKDWKEEMINIIVNILKQSDEGDILGFVKSGGEGRQLCQKLKEASIKEGLRPFCVELESKSKFEVVNEERQISKEKFAINMALYKTHPNADPNNPYDRKVVFATNAAESSITVDGIVYVIDSGLEYNDKYFPCENARSLMEEFISQSAVIQRRGRAGRTREGYCYHLYTEKQYSDFENYPVPDIQKTDLSPYLLDLLRMEGIGTIQNLRNMLASMIDPPHAKFVDAGLSILYGLGAIDNINTGNVTQLGIDMSFFRALKPTLAKSIIVSYQLECSREVCDIVAMIILTDGQMESLFKTPYEREQMGIAMKKHKALTDSYGDQLTMLKTYRKYIEKKEKTSKSEAKRWSIDNFVSFKILDKVSSTSQKLRSTLRQIMTKNKNIENLNKNNISTNNNMKGGERRTTRTTRSTRSTRSTSTTRVSRATKISESITKRILRSFMLGNYINIGISIGKRNYQTCYSQTQTIAQLSRHSVLNYYKSLPKNVLYDELFNFGTGFKFNICCKISDEMLKDLTPEQHQILTKCKKKKLVEKKPDKKYKKTKGKYKSKYRGKYKGKYRGKHKSKKT